MGLYGLISKIPGSKSKFTGSMLNDFAENFKNSTNYFWQCFWLTYSYLDFDLFVLGWA